MNLTRGLHEDRIVCRFQQDTNNELKKKDFTKLFNKITFFFILQLMFRATINSNLSYLCHS